MNLDLEDGSRLVFKDGFGAARPAQAGVTRIQDRYGNAIVLTRNADSDLTRITSPSGRWIDLTYDTSHRITQAKDAGGRTVGYTYDASGRLWKVTDPMGGVTEYTYDGSHRMLTLKDARGIVFLTNEYDGNGRVVEQTQADDTTYRDTHCWAFTPESCALILHDLRYLGLLALDVADVSATHGNEFYVHLRKPERPATIDDRAFYDARARYLRAGRPGSDRAPRRRWIPW